MFQTKYLGGSSFKTDFAINPQRLLLINNLHTGSSIRKV